MANYSVTLNLVVGGTTLTQNFTTGDTITATINTQNNGVNWSLVSNSGCSVSASTGTDGSSVVITPTGSSAGATYSAEFDAISGTGKNTITTAGTVDGTWQAVAPDETPDNYTNLAGNVSSASTSTFYYATFSTTTAGTTDPGTGLNLSGQINQAVTITPSSGEFRTAANTTWRTSGTVTSSDTLYFRARSSSLGSVTRIHGLGIGTVSHSFTTNTSGSTGAAGYGFKVFNSSGSQTIVDSDTDRQAIGIVTGTAQITGNGGTSGSISCPGMDIYNQDIIDVIYLNYPVTVSGFGSIITNRGNGSFTITLNAGSSGITYDIKYVALRY